MNESTGILWLVDDDPDQRRRFEMSYRSASIVCPEVDRHVLYMRGAKPKDGAQKLDTMFDGAGAKFDAFNQSPFDRTLFLDNDTVMLRDPRELLRTTEYVTALPYPSFFQRKHIVSHASPGENSIQEWRNVNSGVVVFDRRFLCHYEAIWEEYGHLVDTLPAYDQCLFSLALATAPCEWTPNMSIQVTTTRHSLAFMKYWYGVADTGHTPKIGDVPLTLANSVMAFHYTSDKSRYEKLLSEDSYLLWRESGNLTSATLDTLDYDKSYVYIKSELVD